MNHHTPIAQLSLIILFLTTSCISKAKKSEDFTSSQAPTKALISTFEVDNKKLDLAYIQSSCAIVKYKEDLVTTAKLRSQKLQLPKILS